MYKLITDYCLIWSIEINLEMLLNRGAIQHAPLSCRPIGRDHTFPFSRKMDAILEKVSQKRKNEIEIVSACELSVHVEKFSWGCSVEHSVVPNLPAKQYL